LKKAGKDRSYSFTWRGGERTRNGNQRGSDVSTGEREIMRKKTRNQGNSTKRTNLLLDFEEYCSGGGNGEAFYLLPLQKGK